MSVQAMVTARSYVWAIVARTFVVRAIVRTPLLSTNRVGTGRRRSKSPLLNFGLFSNVFVLKCTYKYTKTGVKLAQFEKMYKQTR